MRPQAGLSFLVAFLLWGIAQPAPGVDRFDGLDAYIQDALEKWEVPGLAIAVLKDDELVLARGYGVCQNGGARAVTKDTVFSIASCTKSFTAACIGMLVDEKKVRWDDAVRAHLPNFQVADSYVSQNATLRDLLCHRTGLIRGDLLSGRGDFDNDEIFRRLRFLQQAQPFRTSVTYSSLMFEVLGRVVEEKSRIPWQTFVTERLLQPLGMGSTYITVNRVPSERLAVRHRHADGRVALVQKPFPEHLVMPAGAIHSSVIDMARWLKFQLHEGEHDGQQLLSPAAIRDMHSLVQSIPIRRRPDANVYSAQMIGTGLGWFVQDYRGRKVVEHGGGWGAFTAIVPEENLAVVVLSNLDYNLLVNMLTFDMIDAYLVGPERAFSKGMKWDFWLNVGGPDAPFKVHKEQKADLDKHRVPGTTPSLPLEKFVGRYESDFYGPLIVTHDGERLHGQLGQFSAALDHWQDNTFYAPAVVIPFLDWHVKFQLTADKNIESLEIINIGWKDPDERHIFRRVP